MQEQFVPHEIAIKLKEAGFDEPCFGYYDTDGDLYLPFKLDTDEDFGYYFGKLSDDHIKAPLWQQAIDWLCEVHHLHISIHFGYGWEFTIQSTKSKEVVYYDGTYNSPAEARKGGIEYALSLI